MIENRMIGKGAAAPATTPARWARRTATCSRWSSSTSTASCPPATRTRYATGTYATGNKLRGIRNYAANFPCTGAFPTPGIVPAGRPAELQRHRLRHRPAPRCTPTARSGSRSTSTSAQGARREVRRAVPASPTRRCRRAAPRRAAGGPVPGQPALDPAPVRRLPAHADEPVDGRRPQRDPRRRPDALRRRRPGTSCGPRSPGAASAGSRRRPTAPAARAASSRDTDPLPDFEAPGTANATVTFEAHDAEQRQPAVQARIYVGHYEARVSPIADTDPAHRRAAGATAEQPRRRRRRSRPGTYEFVATAPGYGAVRFRETFAAGDEPDDHAALRAELGVEGRRARRATGDATP